MPLPTPASSVDLKARDGIAALRLGPLEELPPPAIPSSSLSDLSPGTYPIQASEAVKSRRRASIRDREAGGAGAGAGAGSGASADAVRFELPPPPTRSRRIIQMKPRDQQQQQQPESRTDGDAVGQAAEDSRSSQKGGGAAPTKRKHPSGTSVAGRKMARKTAHSLIERRRRSKMNDEFAVLKGMIPACSGEMHKLAILQAAIDYMRYLEDCVSRLNAQQPQSPGQQAQQQPPRRPPVPLPDVEMAEQQQQQQRHPTPAASPAQSPKHPLYFSSSTSSSSASSSSSAYMPMTSPEMLPQSDREATAALLMLNPSNRRPEAEWAEAARHESGREREGVRERERGRGISVMDLLIT